MASCVACLESGVSCAWNARQSRIRATSASQRDSPGHERLLLSMSSQAATNLSSLRPLNATTPLSTSQSFSGSGLPPGPSTGQPRMVQPSEWGNIKELIRLYFSTVHCELAIVQEANGQTSDISPSSTRWTSGIGWSTGKSLRN